MKKSFVRCLSMLLVMSILVGCPIAFASDGSGDKLEEVTLKWYMWEDVTQTDRTAVEEAINEYLKDDLNIKLEFVVTDSGSYGDKVQMAIASGEEFDICFTSNWLNNYTANASKNAYYELDELLTEYGKELYETIPQAGWDACKVNGKIYGVPNMQIWAKTYALEVGTEYLEKYNFDLSTVKTIEEIEPLLAQIKADNPNMYPVACLSSAADLSNWTPYVQAELMISSDVPVVLDYSDPSNPYHVTSAYDLEALESVMNTLYAWNQKGYIRSDAATATESHWTDMAKRTSCIKWCTGYNPGAVVTESAQAGYDLTIEPISESYLCTAGIVATMTAISRTSKNPERAMMFLNRLNTDPVLYNLVTRGIEGVHYTNENGYAIPIENSGFDQATSDWEYGNVFNGLLMEGYPENIWEGTMSVNNNAKVSAIMGFSADTSELETEMATVSSVVAEYSKLLLTGCVDPAEVLPEMRERLESAGMNTIVEEIQRQVDEWVAANK